MSESQVSHETSSDRAAWQRKTGQVVMTQAADVIFSNENLETELQYVWHSFDETRFRLAGKHQYWRKAHTLLDELYSDRIQAYGTASPQMGSEVENEFSIYTYMGSTRAAIREGIGAQIHFSLNLAELITKKAEVENIEGFETQTFGRVARLLRRDDFGAMVDMALFAHNGTWEEFSSAYGAGITVKDGKLSGGRVAARVIPHVVFEAGEASFSEEFQRSIRAWIGYINKRGRADGGHIPLMGTTSGCPARHLRPHFTSSETDQVRLQQLAEHYDTTSDALEKRREQTVVRNGLESMAQVLDYYDPYVTPNS